MKIKKKMMGWFIFSLIVTLGYIGLMIYQIINGDFDPMNIIIVLFVAESFAFCIEKKKK